MSGNRYAPAVDTQLTEGGGAKAFSEAGSDAKAFYAPNGKYTVVVDWPTRTARLESSSWTGIDDVISGDTYAPEEGEAVYYNLQGVRVVNPSDGIYIKISGGKTSKVKL